MWVADCQDGLSARWPWCAVAGLLRTDNSLRISDESDPVFKPAFASDIAVTRLPEAKELRTPNKHNIDVGKRGACPTIPGYVGDSD